MDDSIVVFISDFTEEFGFPPSFRDVAKYVGCSPATIMAKLQKLRFEGRVTWIERSDHRVAGGRTLKVVA